LRNVGRQEAPEVEPVVGGQVDADAVDRERHLKAVEPAHEDQPFVARTPAVAPGHTGQEVDRIVERDAGKGAHGRRGQGLAADLWPLRRGRGDHDLAQRESLSVGRRRCGIIGPSRRRNIRPGIRRHVGARLNDTRHGEAGADRQRREFHESPSCYGHSAQAHAISRNA
jgi:hypothetical protein